MRRYWSEKVKNLTQICRKIFELLPQYLNILHNIFLFSPLPTFSWKDIPLPRLSSPRLLGYSSMRKELLSTSPQIT